MEGTAQAQVDFRLILGHPLAQRIWDTPEILATNAFPETVEFSDWTLWRDLQKGCLVDNQLLTLSKIFTERLFRIPDYQRGYAWTEKQLKDFWSDIQQLDGKSNHYTGVLTLESVAEDCYSQWMEDLWIIENKSFQPFFVVDGQQRLTTSIILIQCIIESMRDGEVLNFTSKSDIQKRFVFDSKDGGISRSYAFGYERDNPSYEFLKTKIFCEHSPSSREEETIYTQNLGQAKVFFSERIDGMTLNEKETLYKKVTQQLLFNIFTIADEVDVCVAFETMNNRGKPLSYLELLKNRLIYLSLKFDDGFEKSALRSTINECWKSIYHNLGRNKDQPLEDDLFLKTHYLMYFGNELVDAEDPDDKSAYLSIRRMRNIYYAEDLLESRFVAKNVLADAPKGKRVSLTDVYTYVNSLQGSVVTWYKIFNPFDSDYSYDVKIWLDKINRIGGGEARLLLLVFLQHEKSQAKILEFLQVLERRLFLHMLTSGAYSVNYFELQIDYLDLSNSIMAGRLTSDKLIKTLFDKNNAAAKNTAFTQYWISNLKSAGFYGWAGIRYFLYEYNLELQHASKTDRKKIFWPEFIERRKDFVTVEHVYPRHARSPYWTGRFGSYSQKQKEMLRNSLGNLLPLSQPKNSSLSNKPFPEKVEGKASGAIGYRYGCYAENEAVKENDWTPEVILSRGIKLLTFMQKRWGIDLGDDSFKKSCLGLDFLP